MTSVTIGSGVTNLGDSAFYGCTAMTSLTSQATTPPTCGTDAFGEIDKENCTLHVPTGTTTLYQAADQWKDFYHIVDGATVWSGQYLVSSSHVESYPTQEYQDNFEMTIEEKDGTYYITSMFGDDLTLYNNGGFELHDNGDGTATIDVSYYNILKYTDNNSPLYALYVYDETADDWADTWTLQMNEDGSITLGEFYVAAFSWDENEEVWGNGQLEALYYSLTAAVEDMAGISNTVVETPNIHVTNGTITVDEIVDITVYRDNGMMVFSGKTNSVENLPKGLYIVRIGRQGKKILIK